MRAIRLALVGAMGAALACGGGEAPTQPGNNNPGGCTSNCGGGNGNPVTPGSTTNAIDVTDNAFSPTATTVNVGTTVTWTWKSFDVHNVTFSNTSLGHSDDQDAGTYQKTFNVAGTFAYQCTRHIGMTASITVKTP